MPDSASDPTGVTRRTLLGVAVTALGLSGCGSEAWRSLRAVDAGRIRLDDEPTRVTPRVELSPRERRRRDLVQGAAAAVAALSDPGAGLGTLPGAFGGGVPVAAAVAAHDEHRAVLLGEPRAPRLGPRPDPGGPLASATSRPVAVLGASAEAAVAASLAELAEPDANPDLALLSARIGAARSAQSRSLRPTARLARWPTVDAGDEVAQALQLLLASEHRAAWSYAVVQAWSQERRDDAATARQVHARRVAELSDTVRLLGAQPVAASATYPTAIDGRGVDGPNTAAALALQLEDGVAETATAVLAASGLDGGGQWLAAAVTAAADAERARWSWGGTVRLLSG